MSAHILNTPLASAFLDMFRINYGTGALQVPVAASHSIDGLGPIFGARELTVWNFPRFAETVRPLLEDGPSGGPWRPRRGNVTHLDDYRENPSPRRAAVPFTDNRWQFTGRGSHPHLVFETVEEGIRRTITLFAGMPNASGRHELLAVKVREANSRMSYEVGQIGDETDLRFGLRIVFELDFRSAAVDLLKARLGLSLDVPEESLVRAVREKWRPLDRAKFIPRTDLFHVRGCKDDPHDGPIPQWDSLFALSAALLASPRTEPASPSRWR